MKLSINHLLVEMSMIISIFGIYSCSSNSEDNLKYVLEKTEMVSIPVGEQCSVESGTMNFFKDPMTKEEIIISHNKVNHVVSEINLTTRKEHPLFKISSGGPNGVGWAYHVQKLRRNKYMVLASNSYLLSILDSLGHRLEQYNFLDDPNDQYAGYPWVDLETPFFTKDSVAYMRFSSSTNPYSKDSFKGENALYAYDFNSHTHHELFEFPDEACRKSFGLRTGKCSVCLSLDEKQLLVSFPSLSYILSYDLKTHKRVKYPAAVSGGMEVEPDQHKQMPNFPEYDLTTPILYTSLLRDPYRKVYYRIVVRGLDKELVKRTKYKYWSYKPLTVITLDEHFNKIAETSLEKDHYSSIDYFVGEKGFYIKAFHPDDKTISEDEIRFQCYTLNKRS
ncbi:MAG: DUF4221 domain-containing protein [Prolixibacteraceae bacterium]|nr:DUF4221 domain-containing protein [Prolixibacteraceae bacterium]